jgi:hypothetical protein
MFIQDVGRRPFLDPGCWCAARLPDTQVQLDVGVGTDEMAQEHQELLVPWRSAH